MDGSNDVTGFEALVSIVSKYAPSVATILGSPLAGIGISLLCDLFNVGHNNVDELHKAIENDNNAPMKIKNIELIINFSDPNKPS